ncbi:disease resistance-like protein DSC1 [Pistacia vera]|uniref:disease resistance-like protein DSC1 n=1 Tax=Pistacia vera TaxID=55513 RepID=UPI001262EBB7|nr:disease resistance-like protein DSC1 [Pistacia vera]
MGWDIVRQESRKEPGNRSRLWDPQDIFNLFKKNTGTQSVEGIFLDLSKVSELHLSSDAFTRMHKLRLLKLYSSHYGKGEIEDDKVHLCQGLEFLSDELRYLHWHRYPLRSLPCKFNPENLVELDMHHSNVEYLWKEKQHLVNLRRIDLSYSQHLTEIPDLTLAPNLEVITLDGCSHLTKFPGISWNIKKLHLGHTAIEEVPSAIECLNNLDSLLLINCTRLKNLPRSIQNLTTLMHLDLRGCSNITEFPEVSGDIKYLYLNETAIQELPSSVEYLTKLNTLSLGNCTNLESVPSGLFKLKCLEVLYLFGCSKLGNLPEISESMEKLELQGTAIKELPYSIERLTQLSLLHLGDCKNLTSLPNNFFQLTSLSSLRLSGLSGIDKLLDNLPLSLFSGLCSLVELNLNDCNLVELPSALSCLSSSEYLDLTGNNFESLSLKPFSCLKSLDVSYCKRLQSILEFPSPLHLTDFQAHDCLSLKTMPNSMNLAFTADWNSQQSFTFSNCFNLTEDAQRNILADAELRIQVMATNAQETASMEDYLEWYWPGASVSICFPGNEIPGWFSHQNVGSSVTMELPQHWSSSKFLGFALCVVVTFDDYHDYMNFNVECKCEFETNDGDKHNIDCGLNGLKAQYKSRSLSSDHVFLFFHERLYAILVQRDDQDHFFSVYQSCHKVLFEFLPVDDNRLPLLNCKVKKCGVCILNVKEEDAEIFDGSNVDDHVESESDSNSNHEVQEDPNSQTLKEKETNLEANAFWSAQGRANLLCMNFLVGVAVVLFLRYFLGVVSVNGFKKLLVSLLQ